MMAYFMMNPLYAGTSETLYSLVFIDAVQATTTTLSTPQDLGSVFAGMFGAEAATMRMAFGGLIATAFLVFAFVSADFRTLDNILGGLVIGLAVIGAWYVTGGPLGQEWMAEMEWADQKPIGVGVQSMTFINPMGEGLRFLMDPKMLLLSFGVITLAGVIVGSFIWAVLTGGFRVEWFNSTGDFFNHAIGGILMGVGGVLAMGCTIGQGITGFSTLAMGSIMAFASIVFGSALTMKVQYYKMVYEDEASFAKAFVTALADMRMLPNSMRKLEAV
jgi:uncharacterized membrane protein YedE/YeeE